MWTGSPSGCRLSFNPDDTANVNQKPTHRGSVNKTVSHLLLCCLTRTGYLEIQTLVEYGHVCRTQTNLGAPRYKDPVNRASKLTSGRLYIRVRDKHVRTRQNMFVLDRMIHEIIRLDPRPIDFERFVGKTTFQNV